jgi:hypothetical protein
LRFLTLPARRAFIAVVLIGLSLISGYAYVAIAIAVIFLLSWFFFPVKQPQDFFAGVIPAVDALTEYMRHLSAGNVTPQSESRLLQTFATKPYPNWVYRSGFNPGLRSGFRHFLIQLEHASDLCCSAGYWFSMDESVADKAEFMHAMRDSLKINGELLAGLSRTMHHHAEKTLRPVNDTNVDFVSDINALEDVLKTLVPPSLELLDMSQEYVQMTSIVRNVKDLREVLLLLVNGVPVGG